jgi:hypothetical protein
VISYGNERIAGIPAPACAAVPAHADLPARGGAVAVVAGDGEAASDSSPANPAP